MSRVDPGAVGSGRLRGEGLLHDQRWQRLLRLLHLPSLSLHHQVSESCHSVCGSFSGLPYHLDFFALCASLLLATHRCLTGTAATFSDDSTMNQVRTNSKRACGGELYNHTSFYSAVLLWLRRVQEEPRASQTPGE